MQQIIWISPGFAAHESDSQCIPPQQLLASVLGRKDQVKLHIISLHYPYTSIPYKWHGIQVFPSYRKGILQKIRIWYRAYQQLRKLLRQYPNAIVHSFWMNDACWIATLATGRTFNRHVVTLMGQDARPRNRYLSLVRKSGLEVIALSKYHAQQYYASTGQTVNKIIPWGLPVVPKPTHQRSIDLIAIGNLIPLKQFNHFVRLIDRVRSTIPQLRALLIGDGPELESLRKQAQDIGVDRHIEFTGALDRQQVLQLLSQSKVLVHPSSYESFGFVMLEALQQGAAVVAYPIGIAAELPGATVASDFDSLVQASLKALELPGSAALPKIFQLDHVAERYLQLYGRLIIKSS